MKKPIVIDAEFSVVRPGRGSRVEETRKRRRQFWDATLKELAMQGTLVAAVAVVTALLLRVV